jgi:hypothetical protein
MKRNRIITETLINAIISYFVTFILDKLLFLKVREISFNNPNLFINRPGSSYDILFYYFILTMVVLLIYYLVVVYLNFYNKRKKWVTKLVPGLISLVVIVISLKIFLPIAKVSSIMEIQGHVKNVNTYSYLFVRPTLGDQYWVQTPIPLVLDQNGNWIAGAHFGGRSGLRFEVILINSKRPLNPNIINGVGSYDFNIFPLDIERFIRIVQLK